MFRNYTLGIISSTTLRLREQRIADFVGSLQGEIYSVKYDISKNKSMHLQFRSDYYCSYSVDLRSS